MKTLIILISFLFASSNFSYSYIYRTNSSGDWNSNLTWQASPDGGVHWCVLPGCIIDSVFYSFPIPNAANSDQITIRVGHNVTVSTNTNIDNMTIQNGGTITITTGIDLNITYSSSYDLNLKSGGAINGTGTLTLNSTLPMYINIESGADFNVDLNIQCDVNWSNLSSSDTSVLRKNLVIDSSCVLSMSGATSIRVKGDITCNGIIYTATTGPVSRFVMEGNNLINNGDIRPSTLEFDGNTILSGNGIYGDGTFSSSNIIINPSKAIALANNATFGLGGAIINLYGTINPNSHVFTVHSSGGANIFIHANANVTNSGIFQSLGRLNLVVLPGANFNCPLKLSSGQTDVYCQTSPFIAVLKQSVTVDPGAVLEGGVFGNMVEVRGNVINDGTISGPNSIFRMKGTSLINNGTLSIGTLEFDSTTSISGGGTFSSGNIFINNSKNMTLASNVTFSSSHFRIFGALNPNTKIITLTSGILYIYSSSIISNSGLFQTRNNITFNMDSGSIFNCPLKVNTGTTTVNSFTEYEQIFNRSITIDSGATFYAGISFLKANDNVTNNGTLQGNFATFRFAGSNFTNNGNVTVYSFNFEPGNHNLSGTGNFTSQNLHVLNLSIVNMQSNHNVAYLNVNSGGTFNLNSKKLQVTGYNPIINNGIFNTTGGNVEYIGPSTQQVSATNIIYGNLTINNPNGVSAQVDFTVNNTLSLTNGDLDLNGQTITLSPANGNLSETSGNTVKGTSGVIQTTRTLNSPSGLNVAGLGAVLTASANLGSTLIKRGHSLQYGLVGNQSISRYFDILPSNNSGLNATLGFKYDYSELDTLQESSLGLFRSTNEGQNYSYAGGTVDTANNQISLSGINSFSRWSASLSASATSANITLIIEGLLDDNTLQLNSRDTVTAYLANSTSPFNFIDSAKSVIDSVSYTGSFLFGNAPSGFYYIVIKHRNGIETWSKSGGEEYNIGKVLNYNFTGEQTQAYGDNLKLISGLWCMYSGDVNNDGAIDLGDLGLIDNDSYNFVGGYVNSDLNRDGIVDLADLTIADNNALNFVSVVKP